MNLIELILIVLALVCFIAAAVGAKVGSLNLVAAGLACWVAVVLLGMIR